MMGRLRAKSVMIGLVAVLPLVKLIFVTVMLGCSKNDALAAMLLLGKHHSSLCS